MLAYYEIKVFMPSPGYWVADSYREDAAGKSERFACGVGCRTVEEAVRWATDVINEELTKAGLAARG